MKRFISVVMLLLMLCCAFSACKDNAAEPQSNKTVVQVNGKIMSSIVYEYYLDNELLNNPDAPVDENKEAAVKQTARLLYINELCAEKGININDEGRTAIDNQINSLIEHHGSEQEFLNYLTQYNLDYDTFYALLENEYLETVLKTEVFQTYTDKDRQDFYNNNMINVQHILITTVDENLEPLDDTVIADKKALAQEVKNQLDSGSDFQEMVGKYNEDTSLTQDGIMMSRYSGLVRPFINAAFELDVNEVSAPVETYYGYHIIKRYEHKGNAQWFENSINDINDALFEQQFDDWYNKADIVVN